MYAIVAKADVDTSNISKLFIQDLLSVYEVKPIMKGWEEDGLDRHLMHNYPEIHQQFRQVDDEGRDGLERYLMQNYPEIHQQFRQVDDEGYKGFTMRIDEMLGNGQGERVQRILRN
ncbi:hypothetical protein NW752_008536 [Fusarium irregulare]|nr:hypothetical protein NW752_008536 [Fusarium irregulare]